MTRRWEGGSMFLGKGAFVVPWWRQGSHGLTESGHGRGLEGGGRRASVASQVVAAVVVRLKKVTLPLRPETRPAR
jgi:hypothetical protein